MDQSSSWSAAKRNFATAQSSTAFGAKTSKDDILVSVFPSVARSALTEPDVSKLYGFIRQLHTGDDIDNALSSICELLQTPECKDLLNLMPNVLKGAISDRFVEMATSLGLPLDLSLLAVAEYDDGDGDNVDATTSGTRNSSMATFFDRIQQKRRRKQQETAMPTAAVVKDPQCVVCYDITRKAYAAQCGHICCMGCWKKVSRALYCNSVCSVPLNQFLSSCMNHTDGERRVHFVPAVQSAAQV